MNAQAISTATILVRFADPAPAGKKQATIKASDGTVYGVWPKDFGRFQPGGRYAIEYTERPYNGRMYRTIVKAEPEAAPQRPPASARVTAPSVPQATPSREPNPSVSSAEAEFVSRCLAASIAACSVGRTKEERVAAGKMWREVWREVFGA